MILFTIMTNNLLADWHLRVKFVDNTSAIEILPRNSINLLNSIVSDIHKFSMDHNTRLNPKCKEMFINLVLYPKGLFTRYDFVACDKLTTGLRHELFRVNQTYNSLTTLKSCRRPVVSLLHATKSCRVNRP